MALIDLALLKAHVRVDEFTDEEAYLLHLLEAAEEYVCTATNRSPEELKTLGGGKLPTMLQQAVLLVAGHWYNQREGVAGVQMVEVPYTIGAMIKPYRKLVTEVEQ